MPAMLQTKGLFPVYRLEEYGGHCLPSVSDRWFCKKVVAGF